MTALLNCFSHKILLILKIHLDVLAVKNSHLLFILAFSKEALDKNDSDLN